MKIFNKIFKPNDWRIFTIHTCTYKVRYPYRDITKNETTIAELWFSPSRNRFKIKESGYYPESGWKTSLAYLECLKEQQKLQNK
jgi:hypothetical protein